jgi:carboxyl-terminal processing protease
MTAPIPAIRVKLWVLALVVALCLIAIGAATWSRAGSAAADETSGPSTAVDREARAADEDAARARLSSKARRQICETIWREIHDHYYDPGFNGVNWDEVRTRYLPRVADAKTDQEFYGLMSEMTGELHDAHTRFSSPEQWRNYRKQQGVSTGLSVEEVDGKVTVISVRPDSSADRAGIAPGMVVLNVDGKPVQECVAEIEKSRPASSSQRATRLFAYSRLFAGPLNTTVRVGLERRDGTRFEATLTRLIYSAAPEVATNVLPLGSAYIRFDGFQPSVSKPFKQALERFRNSPGVVIDLRRNGGGDLSVLLPMAGYFFDKKTLFAKDATRSGKPLSEFAGILRLPLELYVGRAGDQLYAGPVAILVDARSASSSEVFAAGMQDTERAKVIGSATCGCVLGIAKPRVMKGGGVLEMSEVAWFSPKGRKLEGAGIVPDAPVTPSLADLQGNRDPVVAEADRVLHQMAMRERKVAQR